MGKALGIIGIIAGAILLITGFLTIFYVIFANLSLPFLAIPGIFMVVGAPLIAYGNRSRFYGKVGSTIEPKSVFCRYCGKKLSQGSTVPHVEKIPSQRLLA